MAITAFSSSGRRSITAILFVVLQLIVKPSFSQSNSDIFIKKYFLAGTRQILNHQNEEAIENLLKIKDLDVAMRDYILFYLGRAFRDLGRQDEAREVFGELLEVYPESRWAAYARVQRDAGVEGKKTPCETLPKVSERADCFFKARRYGEARGLYKDLTEEPSDERSRSVFYLERLSQSASRSQDFETALMANQRIRTEFPGTKEGREASRKIASLYQESGDYRAAIGTFEGLLEHSTSPYEKRQYWERIGWSHFRLGSYAEAIRSFDGGLREAETPFLLYWKGKSLERLGRVGEAKALFLGLGDIYRETYYGIRALERLKGYGLMKRDRYRGWWSSRGKRFRWDRQVVSLEESPDLEKIRELYLAGLEGDAAIELRRARARLHLPLPEDPRRISKRGDLFVFENRSLRDEDPDYPVPYADYLFSKIRKSRRKIDPLLVAAMMKQESRFRESAVSPTGAIGLLQIMPETGRGMAREAGWSEFDSDWLYDPLTNIELAVRYINKLSGLFHNKWYLIAAAYNAGEDVVGSWLQQRQGLSEEEFIEEIPYQETRDYVKKVYTHWKAYRAIYGGD